ncbi:MAG: hypothetical protein WC683_08150 [bacterium]
MRWLRHFLWIVFGVNLSLVWIAYNTEAGRAFISANPLLFVSMLLGYLGALIRGATVE